MASHKVVEDFKDLQDNDYIYYKGDTFPREGANVSDERIQELSSDKNKRKTVLIKSVEEYPKHTGGGYYELSNGEKVQGKQKAVEVEEALKEGDN